MSNTVSADSVVAMFPHVKFTPINGEPSHHKIKVAKNQISENLLFIFCKWGHGKGHLSVLQDLDLDLKINGAPFTEPAAALPVHPSIVPIQTAAEHYLYKSNNRSENLVWKTYVLMNIKGVNFFA